VTFGESSTREMAAVEEPAAAGAGAADGGAAGAEAAAALGEEVAALAMDGEEEDGDDDVEDAGSTPAGSPHLRHAGCRRPCEACRSPSRYALHNPPHVSRQ